MGVFFNGIITTTWLKEPFSKQDAIGLLAIALGVIIVISSVPEVQLDLTSEFIMRCAHLDEMAACAFGISSVPEVQLNLTSEFIMRCAHF